MDNDESMLSTPSSHQEDDTLFDNDDQLHDENDDENLFPGAMHDGNSSAYVPAMTPANDHLNAAAPGELSPPRSQSLSRGTNIPTTWDDLVPDADGPETDEGLSVKRTSEKEQVGAWKSKKAQDEMRRAWDFVVDKDFSLKEYGDVLAGKQG